MCSAESWRRKIVMWTDWRRILNESRPCGEKQPKLQLNRILPLTLIMMALHLYSTAFFKHVIIQENCSKNLNFNAEWKIKASDEEEEKNLDVVGEKRSTFSFKLLVRKCETFLYRLSVELSRISQHTEKKKQTRRREGKLNLFAFAW